MILLHPNKPAKKIFCKKRISSQFIANILTLGSNINLFSMNSLILQENLFQSLRSRTNLIHNLIAASNYFPILIGQRPSPQNFTQLY